MNPTFLELDILTMEPCQPELIRVGDVIVFLDPEKSQKIVHRVIRKSQEGFITQGDHRLTPDQQPVANHRVQGIVRTCTRQNRTFLVKGGLIVRLRVRLRRILTRVSGLILRPISQLLQFLASHKIRLPGQRLFQVITINMEDEVQLRLQLGRRIIGEFDKNRQIWVIRPAYRIFINPDKLPHP